MRRIPLGPGILLAATSIGASHILMSPEAGARYGFSLMWLVIGVHVLKYPAFACAPRYVVATGESLLDAYREAPGPRGWAIWMGLADMSIQALGLIAALVGLTASFLQAAVGGRTVLWALAIAAGLLLALAAGRYRWLRLGNLILVGFLTLGTVVAFTAAPPDPRAFAGGLVPSLPSGSLLLVAAILGFMPTSVAVSVWQSLWAIEQRKVEGAPTPPEPGNRRAALGRALTDLRIGYALSLVLAILFISLGATLLQPRGLVPSGPQVAITLSEIYTLALGATMRPVFLAVAFAALLSTCYTMMDGFPRAFVAAWRQVRPHRTPSTGTDAGTGGRPYRSFQYWAFILFTTFAGMAILALIPDPAFLVEAVGALGLLLSPVYFSLNVWAVRRRIDDPALRPGRVFVAFATAGILFMTLTAGFLVWTTFIRSASP